MRTGQSLFEIKAGVFNLALDYGVVFDTSQTLGHLVEHLSHIGALLG